MTITEIIGYVASVLVVATFTMNNMLWLRSVAVLSNIGFLVYGFLGELWPVFGLHVVLLPLNLARIRQLRRLVGIADQVDQTSFPASEILPYGKVVTFPAGHTVFSAGDHADAFYFLVFGQVTVPESGFVIGEGELFGEIGLFSDERVRTAAVVCTTEVEAVEISRRDLWRIFRKDPAASYELTRVVVNRLLA